MFSHSQKYRTVKGVSLIGMFYESPRTGIFKTYRKQDESGQCGSVLWFELEQSKVLLSDFTSQLTLFYVTALSEISGLFLRQCPCPAVITLHVST